MKSIAFLRQELLQSFSGTKLFLVVCVLASVGCQLPGRIAIKATPSRLVAERFDYTIEFLLDNKVAR